MGGVVSRIRGGKRYDKETTPTTGDVLSNLDDIARFVNLAELKPTFVEEGLLEVEDLAVDLGPAFREYSRQSDRMEYLKTIFVSEEKREAFQRCIQKSVDDGGHLGHDYIATLLDDTQTEFAEERWIGLSEHFREQIESKMCQVVKCMKPTLLYHPMMEKRLLTFNELEKFGKRDLTDIEINEKLLALIGTKGPTAHLLLMQCLTETRESLSCHGELCDLIARDFSGMDFSVGSTKPEQPLGPLQVPQYFKGQEYHERRCRFEVCYHNGDWTGLYEESRKCAASENPVTVAIGYLELALGWIFQLNEVEVRKNLELAHDIIMTLTPLQNPDILYARCEYLHALLLRYLKQYAEASKKAEVAIMMLMQYEIGEDKSFAQYCYATSFVETLAPNCTNEEFQKAKKMLITAIDYAQQAEDMGILVTYSQLQLARLYLGTTDTFLSVTCDQNRIGQSNRLLKELETKLQHNELNIRFESLYYIRKSDYERAIGYMELAVETAKKAETLALNAKLPIEEKAAKNRIIYIQQCLHMHSKHARIVGQKYSDTCEFQLHARKKARAGAVSS